MVTISVVSLSSSLVDWSGNGQYVKVNLKGFRAYYC